MTVSSLFLTSSSSFLRLLPRLPVTYIPPFILPSITRCRRQFLLKIWPIRLVSRLLISCRIFLCSLTLSNTSSFLTRSVQLIFSILLQDHRCFWSTAQIVHVSALYKAMLQVYHFTSFFLSYKSTVLVKRAVFLLNAAFAIAILDLISQVHLLSFVNMLLKYLKDSTFPSCFWFIIIYTGNDCLAILITFVFSTFISIPWHLPISISLSIMSCSTFSSLVSNTRSSACFTVWMICPPILKSPNPSQSFLAKTCAVQVEQKWWQTASLSNSSSNRHTSCIPSFQLYFNTLSYIQVANQSSFTPVNTSSL